VGEATEFRVRVDAEGADVEEIAEVTRQLRRALLELDGDVLEVSGISSRRQDQLIKVWLDRHAGRRGWGHRRAQRSSSSSCVAGRPAARARTPWPAAADPSSWSDPRPGASVCRTVPASGQGRRLRCGLRPPSDLQLSTYHRIINGGRPALLASPGRSTPVRSRSTAGVLAEDGYTFVCHFTTASTRICAG